MQRVVVVIGINQIHSIDPSVNEAFKTFIGALPRIQGVVYHVFGFFWNPVWDSCRELVERTYRGVNLFELLRVYSKLEAQRTTSETKTYNKYLKCLPNIRKRLTYHFGLTWDIEMIRRRELFGSIFQASKAFLVLKALSSQERDPATRVRETFEGNSLGLHPDINSQVPFQRIRTFIKTSEATRVSMGRFQETSDESSIYFVVMDADMIRLRRGEGIFTRVDRCIQTYGLRSAISLGYSVADDEPPLLRVGIRLDMRVRQALGPLAYFPEPFSAFLARRPREENHLARLSFLGDGEALENRRLYQNGIAQGVLQRDALFVADGGVTMGTPGRMLTGNNQHAAVLNPQVMKQKRSLKAIKGTRQTHASALKWAENVYAGLDFSCAHASDARGPLSHIFAVFDPINRMFAATGRHSSTLFDTIMAQYHDPLTGGLQNLLDTAKGKLRELKMEEAMLIEVEAAARRSGEAIYQELRALTR